MHDHGSAASGPPRREPHLAPGSLAGRTVVVTRSRDQASALVTRLTALGASVVELPVIAIEDAEDGGAAVRRAADEVAGGAYAWVVFTSANAVRRLVDALDGRVGPAGTRWAAVGTSTAKALMTRGIVPDLVPNDAVSDGLVAEFPLAGSAGRAEAGRVLFVRAERVRDVVVPGLTGKGWQVEEAVAYRTVAGSVGPDAIARARAADVVAFTSSSTVERTVDLLGVGGVPPVVASIGPITSGAVRSAGLVVGAEAVEHTLDGLVAAVARAVDHVDT